MAKKRTIITAALTGAHTPTGYEIPATPEQIAEDAYRAWKAGAAVVHLHMRDSDGLGTMDMERFRETIYRIRSYKDCDVIINCTSSGDPRATDDERVKHMLVLDGIEMGSYDAGTFNWMPNVFLNSPKFLEGLGDIYQERGIKPEIEVFDSGMIDIANYYVKTGHLSVPCHFQFCLGVLGGMRATVENLLYMKNHIPEGATWSAFGVGRDHLPILYATIALGGHVRVGLEDNVIYEIGENGEKIKATNEMLVNRAAQAIRTFGNVPATSAEARELLSIPPLDGDAVRRKLGID